MRLPATSTVYGAEAMVCSVDQLASAAGLRMIEAGGNAIDAAIAANAVLTVTSQHMCGLGGDLWSLVHVDGQVYCLNASGRAGSGANPHRLRDAGHTAMPGRGDVAAAPVPGCVDGWVQLHDRFGSLDFRRLLEPAHHFAASGFAVSSQLAASAARNVANVPNHPLVGLSAGDRVVRPGVARTLQAIAQGGRDAFYEGEFGESLIALGAGEYSAADLARSQADWVDPVYAEAWGHRLVTAPPNSQGYLNLGGAIIADGLDLPTDPADPLWAHFLVEASRAAAHDRPDVLHEHADPAALLDPTMLAGRRARISPDHAASWSDLQAEGGTMYLCAVDGNGMGVSLIQSNANGFGSNLVVGDTGIFLHNRGIGFNLRRGHPAEYGPGKRPPHTLSPAMVLHNDGSLRTVLGTMGGDAQPQVVLQMLARLLHGGESPGTILSAPRFALASPDPLTGFDTWSARGDVRVRIEPHASSWYAGLSERGHRVEMATVAEMSGFGHAHLIDVLASGSLAGAADPRAFASAALGR